MAFVILTSIINITMAIFQCIPISAIWNKDIKNARCLSISNIAYSSAACNVATEIFILILPIPRLRGLQLERKKKISLYALFSAGLLYVISAILHSYIECPTSLLTMIQSRVIAVATARIPTLRRLVTFNDPTFDNVAAFLWSCFESGVVHICAAAPVIRSMFTKFRAPPSSSANLKASAPGAFSNLHSIGHDPTILSSNVGTSEKGFADMELSLLQSHAPSSNLGFSPMGVVTTRISANSDPAPLPSMS
jgi:hypothetical protein